MNAEPFIIAHVVPTGVGAEIGGYVGDATPATNLLAGIADKVIAHPNVVNAVAIDAAKDNVLYVEGYSLDRFLLNEIALKEVRSNRIGVVLDCGADEEGIDIAMNTMNMARTVEGINILDYTVTDEPVGGRAVKNESNAFVGEIDDPNIFLKPAKRLMKSGANAIAVATQIKIRKEDLESYFKGKSSNPYGGTEAIISHIISRLLKVPCAHAPILTDKEIHNEMYSGVVDARAGAEAITPAYLGCVLRGLSKAPRIVPVKKASGKDIRLEDLSAVVLPATCLGGIPALACQKSRIPLIAVKENRTVMKMTKNKLKMENVIDVRNYLEATGVIAAMKEGIDFHSIRRPVSKLKRI